MGGHLKDVPKPIIRMFPNPTGKKRKVTAKIHTWRGWGGMHYYASLDEERNPVWDGTTNDFGFVGWREPWDDPEGRGRSYSKRFNEMMQAVKWCEKVFSRLFCKDTHCLEWDQFSCNIPDREGD